MKIIDKLKEKWNKFWLLDQDFEYDDDIRYTNPVREIQHFWKYISIKLLK